MHFKSDQRNNTCRHLIYNYIYICVSMSHKKHNSQVPVHDRTLHDVTDEVIKSLCSGALRRCEGNKGWAARVLGISRDSLYRHIKRFGIEGENQTAD